MQSSENDCEGVEGDGSSHGEAKHGEWENKEHKTEIRESKPLILCCCISKDSCNGDWPTHPWGGIGQNDSSQVEERMDH